MFNGLRALERFHGGICFRYCGQAGNNDNDRVEQSRAEPEHSQSMSPEGGQVNVKCS